MPPAFSQPPPDHDHESVLDPIIEDLCRPIKDLRQNFNVNITDYLSKYMDEIHTIVEVNGETMNFSQAAMMIQGSVGCYSKKVDFLHQYSMKTLNMIGKDRDDEGDNDGDNPVGGIRKRRGDGRLGTGDFVFLDIQMDKNIKKKDQDTDLDLMARKLGFIQVTPREFIEKEGLDAGGSRIEIFYGTNFDLLGYKKDFRMNHQFSMATATFGDRLFLVPEDSIQRGLDETILNEDYHEGEIPDDGGGDGVGDYLAGQHHQDVFLQPQQEENTAMGEGVENVGDHQNDQENCAPEDFHDAEDIGSEHGQSFHEEVRAPQQIRKRKQDCLANLEDIISKDKEPMEIDPWKSEDLFEANEQVNKIKRQKVSKLPPCLRPKKKKSAVSEEPVDLISTFVRESLMRFSSKEFPHLSHHIHLEQERRKQMMKIITKSLKQEGQKDREHIAEAEKEVTAVLGHGEEDEQADLGPDMDDGGVPQNPDEEDDDEVFEPLPAFQCPDPHAGADAAPGGIDGDIPYSVSDTQASQSSQIRQQSYEDLVAKMVAEFVQRSQAWLASTDMARKVQSWHQMIAPRLELVEKRKAFDIHSYGSGILDAFPTQEEEHPIIGFSKVAQNKKKEEVSRYFLASLMLANCHNVEISSQGEINDMQLKFLSTTRHHEQLEEFQAASQQI